VSGSGSDLVETARALACRELAGLGARWVHVQRVGVVAEELAQELGVAPVVVAAAWLHDIGYAPTVVSSGFHPLDGARFLADRGAPAELVSLVAHHTGAAAEAEERGLDAELAEFARPDEQQLDVLTLVDLTTGPDGDNVAEPDRINEILSRYAPDHPVHRAVSRSRSSLLASCRRARRALGLPDVGPIAPLEVVADP
jgi:putative nucleotidyltransferase with HDIG domain